MQDTYKQGFNKIDMMEGNILYGGIIFFILK